jgi:hypothetical protein
MQKSQECTKERRRSGTVKDVEQVRPETRRVRLTSELALCSIRQHTVSQAASSAVGHMVGTLCAVSFARATRLSISSARQKDRCAPVGFTVSKISLGLQPLCQSVVCLRSGSHANGCSASTRNNIAHIVRAGSRLRLMRQY